jgi:hypothetical protein
MLEMANQPSIPSVGVVKEAKGRTIQLKPTQGTTWATGKTVLLEA